MASDVVIFGGGREKAASAWESGGSPLASFRFNGSFGQRRFNVRQFGGQFVAFFAKIWPSAWQSGGLPFASFHLNGSFGIRRFNVRQFGGQFVAFFGENLASCVAIWRFAVRQFSS